MKRERILQVAVGLLGVFYLWPIYPLYTDLWHSKWLLEMHNEIEPMFLSLYVALGILLLLAARNPSENRSLIAFGAWGNIAHATVMAVMAIHITTERRGLLIAAAVVGGIGLLLLVLAPAKQSEQRASAVAA